MGLPSVGAWSRYRPGVAMPATCLPTSCCATPPLTTPPDRSVGPLAGCRLSYGRPEFSSKGRRPQLASAAATDETAPASAL